MNLFIQNNKNILITTVFIFCCLGLYVFFPATGNFQQIVTAVIFFVLLPILYNTVIVKKNRTFYRIHLGDWKKGVFWALVGVAVSLIIVSGFMGYGDFVHKYILPTDIGGNFGHFLFYELVLVAFFTAMYEFFFRGFVLFHFSPFVKQWAVLVQFVLFVLLLWATGSVNWLFAPYLIFAPFAGWIAYKSDSLLYSFVGQLIFIIIIDASVIKMLT